MWRDEAQRRVWRGQTRGVIEGSWRAVETLLLPKAPTVEAAPAITLGELVEKYGAEAIMGANEGRIPGNEAEVAEVAGKLGAGNA